MNPTRRDILSLARARREAVAADIEPLIQAEIAVRFPAGQPPLRLECDLPATLELPLAAESLAAMLAPLVRVAVDAALRPAARAEGLVLREVSVTAVDLGWAVEVEVASTGPVAEAEEPAARVPAATRIAVGLAAGTVWTTRCAEGGMAVTIRLPRGTPRAAAA